MLRSAGDVFTPTLKTLKGVAVPIEIEDLQDGRYRVTYQPEQKTYIVDVLFNNEVSIRNVPVTVTFGKAAQCVLNDGAVPQPQPNLAQCCEYKDLSCCDNFDLLPWADEFQAIDIEFGAYPKCKKALDTLLCGVPCSPNANAFIELGDGSVNGTADVFRVCASKCTQLWGACEGCPLNGVGLTVASMYSAADFCRAIAPDGWEIEVINDEEGECFGAVGTVVSLSGSSAVQLPLPGDGRARVGTPVVWEIRLADAAGAPVGRGGANIVVRVEGDQVDPTFELVDNEDGTYTLTFQTTVAGTYDIHVIVDDEPLTQSPFAAAVFPGAFSPAHSVVYGRATYESPVVGEQSSFLVAAKDQYGNDLLVGAYPFEASEVVAAGAQPGLMLDDPQQLSNATTRFAFTPTKPGDYVIAVTSQGTPIDGVVTFTVNQPASGQKIDSSKSFATGSGLTQAVRGIPARFVIVSVGTNGARLRRGGEQFDVRLSGTDSATGERVMQTPRARDNNDGTYTVEYTILTSPGSYVLDIRHGEDSVRIHPAPSVIKVVAPTGPGENAAAFDATQSEVDVSGVTGDAQLTIGQPATITITARNGVGAPMSGLSFDVTLDGPLGGSAQEQRSTRGIVTDNFDGTYSVAVVATGAGGLYALDVKPAGAPSDAASLQPTPTTTAAWSLPPAGQRQGVFAAEYSEVSGVGTVQATAGRTATFVVTLRDEFSLQLPVGGEPVVATLTDPATSTDYPVAIADNNDGTYTATYELPVDALEGTVALVVQNGDVDLFRGDVNVYEAGTGVLSLENTIVSGQGTTATRVGLPTTLLVLLRDTDNGTFSGAGVPVAAELRGPNIAGYNQLEVAEQGRGTYVVTYIAPTSGLYFLSISVGGAAVPLSPYEVLATEDGPVSNTPIPFMAPIFTANNAPFTAMESWSASLQVAEPLLEAFVNEHTEFEVHALDTSGEPLRRSLIDVHVTLLHDATGAEAVGVVTPLAQGQYRVSFIARHVGVYTPLVTADGVPLPLNMQVRVKHVRGEGELDASACVAFGANLHEAVSGQLSSLFVLARDAAGLPLERSAPGVAFRATLVPRNAAGRAAVLSLPLVDLRDGSYVLRYRAPVPGDYVLSIVEETSGAHVAHSPALLTVTAATAADTLAVGTAFAPEKSVLSGEGLRSAVTGRTARVVVETRDSLRRTLPGGGLVLRAVLDGPTSPEVRVVDRGDGTYVVEYQTPLAGDYTLHLTSSDGRALGPNDGLYSIVVAEWLAPRQFRLSGSGTHSPALPGQPLTLTLTAHDHFGAPLASGGAWLSAQVVLNGERRDMHVTDQNDGTYVLRTVLPADAQGPLAYELRVANVVVATEQRVLLDVAPASEMPLDSMLVMDNAQTTLEAQRNADNIVELLQGVPTRIVVQTARANGDAMTHGGERIGAQLRASHIPGTTRVHSYDVESVVDLGNGRYAIEALVVDSLNGAQWSLVVTRTAPAVGAAPQEIVEEPLAIVVASADARFSSPATSQLAGEALVAPVVVGTHVALKVEPTLVVERVQVTLLGAPSSGPARLSLPLASDTHATSDAALASVPPGLYLVEASVDSQPLRGSPAVVRVVLPHDAAHFEPLSTTLAVQTDADGVAHTATVLTHDAHGRRLSYGGRRLKAVLREQSSEHPTPLTDNGDGSYSVTLRAAETGDAELLIIDQGTGHLLTKRQTTVAKVECVHLWRTISAGAAFSKPDTPTDFFVTPLNCDGSRLDANELDLSTFDVDIVGPAGGELSTNDVPPVLTSIEGDDEGYIVLDAGDIRVRYQAPICGVAQLRVQFQEQNVKNSPHYVTFLSDEPCECGGATLLPSGQAVAQQAYCSGHGVCLTSGQCACEGAWSGDVCDEAPAPAALSAQWSTSGNRITVLFDQDVELSAEARTETQQVGSSNSTSVVVPLAIGESFDCAKAVESVDAIGETATCRFSSTRSLVVFPAATATIGAGDDLSLISDNIVSIDSQTATSTDVVTVTAPDNASPPIVSVEGLSVIGSCSLTSLEYRATVRGLASRPATYEWRALDAASDAVRNGVAANRGAVLTFGAPTLLDALLEELDDSGAALSFEVCATNFLGARGCSQFSIFRNQLQTSTVNIVGASPRRVVSGNELVLPTTITLRRQNAAGECEAVAASDVERVVYTWRRVAGPSLPATVRLSGASLLLPPGTLQPGAQYRFEVDATAYYRDSANQLRVLRGSTELKDSIVLNVAASAAVQARIVPSGNRLVARKEAFSVDGSTSTINGAVGGAQLKYLWSCYEGSDPRRSCWVTGGEPDDDVRTVRFGAFALQPGTYTVELTVQRDTDSSTTSTQITVTAAEVPTVSIRTSGVAPDGSVNAHQPFTLVGTAESTRDREVSAQWDVSPPLGGAEVRDDATGGLYVPAGAVMPGVDYTFTYTANDDDNSQNGVATQVISVNPGPSGTDAACELVGDERAISDEETVSIACRGFDGNDDQLPLAYYATYQTVQEGESSDDASLQLGGAPELGLLASPRAAATLSDVRLPAGEQRLFAYVIDARGAAVRQELGVVVVERTVPLDANENLNDDALTASQVQLGERREQLDDTLTQQMPDAGTQLANIAVQDETSAEGCAQVAETIRNEYDASTSGYNARQQALWVQTQARQCKTSPELRAAHLAILARVASSVPRGQRFVPLGTAADVDSQIAAATGAALRAAVSGAPSVVGEESPGAQSTPEQAQQVKQITRSLSLQLCDRLAVGSPPITSGDSTFALSASRHRVGALQTQFDHANTGVTLPNHVQNSLDDQGTDELCVVHAAHGITASPYGRALNISSPVVAVELVCYSAPDPNAAADGDNEPSLVEIDSREEVSRKRQAVAATRRHECNIGTLPQPLKVVLPQDARGRRGAVPLVCAAWSHDAQAWDESLCQAQVGELDDDSRFACLCDALDTPYATLLGAPVTLPPGAAVVGTARRLPPKSSEEGIVIDWLLLILAILLMLCLYCILCLLWYLKRSNLRYEYLEAQRAKDLEGAGVDYNRYQSEASAEDASLLLRRALIDISQSETTQSSVSTSELGGRGGGGETSSSTSESELGRSTPTESSASELGVQGNDASRSSSSSGSSSGVASASVPLSSSGSGSPSLSSSSPLTTESSEIDGAAS